MTYGPNNRYATAGRAIDQAQLDAGLRQYMLGVYNYMAAGLGISGLVAWLVANVAGLQAVFFQAVETPAGTMIQPNILGYVAMFAPLGILLFGSFKAQSLRASTIKNLYWAFVALQGVGLSLLLEVYTGASVVRVFFITAASFAGLSLFGYTTKRNLSAFGSFLMMGLIGLLIASLVSMFWPSPMLQFVISVAGVLVFAGLTAYETQMIKEQYSSGYDSEVLTKSAVFGAWTLYINFINLFQFLLSLLGNRE